MHHPMTAAPALIHGLHAMLHVPTTALAFASLTAVSFADAPRKSPEAPSQPTDEAPVILEKPDDPWRPPMLLPGSVAGSAAASLGNFISIQVNVDALGMNIPGDAGNEPSIAVDPTAPNRMVIGWRQFDTIESNFREAGYAFSSDGGRSWTFPGTLENNLFRSDPVLASTDDGTIYYYSLRGNFLCDMFTSSDAGQSWSAPTPAFGGDKAWFTVDNTQSPGTGHIYIAWSTAAGCCPGNTFTRSTNGGASFTTPIPIPGTPTFGTLDVDSDGNLYIFGVDAPANNNDDFVLVRSSNAKFAAQPTKFDMVTPINMGGALPIGDGPNPAGLLGQAWVAIDRSGGPSDGNVYVCCTVNRPPVGGAAGDVAGPFPGDPADVMFARSTDGGVTFSPPVRLNDDAVGNNAYQWFGTMAVAPNGRIDVVFNDTRNDSTTTFSELVYTSSNDGGVTWSPNQTISPPFNHFLGYPQQNKLGDYYHLISDDVGAHLAWAATFNGEQDVYYLRIGEYDCNSNGVGDGEDIWMGDLHDCDGNTIPDECEIAANPALDADEDGILDTCPTSCPADLVSNSDFQPPPDGVVDGADLAFLLGEWGPQRPAGSSPADLVTSATFAPPPDGIVDGADLAVLLGAWGPCN